MSLYKTKPERLDGVETIKNSPKDHGVLEMIVIRPKDRERKVLEECLLSAKLGVQGDFLG
jgi:hypothetical protein